MKNNLFVPLLLFLKAIEKAEEWLSIHYWTWYAKNYLQMFGAKADNWDTVQFKGKCILQIQQGATVFFGEGVRCNSGIKYVDSRSTSRITVLKGGELVVGKWSGITNSVLVCKENIKIGNYVNIGAGSIIMDTNFHSTNWEQRAKRNDGNIAKSAPISIGDYVFIGTRCIILKGVTIGEKSIVAAGSIVTKNIPAGEIWGGNPAKFIKKID